MTEYKTYRLRQVEVQVEARRSRLGGFYHVLQPDYTEKTSPSATSRLSTRKSYRAALAAATLSWTGAARRQSYAHSAMEPRRRTPVFGEAALAKVERQLTTPPSRLGRSTIAFPTP